MSSIDVVSKRNGHTTASWTYCFAGGVHKLGILDNVLAVPYSPKLLIMVQSYQIVEFCLSHVDGIKYLINYLCNRNDKAIVQIARGFETYSKIGKFQNTRNLWASEALSWLLRFEIIDKNTPLVILDVHLRNHHSVYFRKGLDGTAAQQASLSPKVTNWPTTNTKWPGAAHIYFAKFPCYFTQIKDRSKGVLQLHFTPGSIKF